VYHDDLEVPVSIDDHSGSVAKEKSQYSPGGSMDGASTGSRSVAVDRAAMHSDEFRLIWTAGGPERVINGHSAADADRRRSFGSGY
jgi:hypothetical protein